MSLPAESTTPVEADPLATLVAATARAVAAAQHPHDALGIVVDAIRALAGVDGAAVLRVEVDGLIPVLCEELDAVAMPLSEAELGIGSGGAYPLIFGGQVEGVLLVTGARPAHQADQAPPLAPLLDLAAITLRDARLIAERQAAMEESERLLGEARERAALFQALHEIAVAVAGILDPKDLARVVADHARALLAADAVAIRLWSEAEEVLYPLYAHDERTESPEPRKRAGEGVEGLAFSRRDAVVIADYATWEHALPAYVERGIRSAAAVPLLSGDRVVGTLTVRYYRQHRVDDPEVEVLRLLAALIAPSIATAREVEERRYAEETVRFQAHLLEAVGQAVIATDPAGVVTYWNHAAEELYGWTATEALGRAIADLTVPETTRQQASVIMSCLRHGETWIGEFVVSRRDGTTFTALVTNSPVVDGQGRMVGIIGISSDISEQKRMVENLAIRAHQQAAVAALGQRVLGTADPIEVMNDAVRVVVDTLRVDRATILEVLPDGEQLVLRAGLGPDIGEVSRHTIRAGADSHAGYALLSGTPVIVDDLRAEARFSASRLRAQGMVSGMAVVIPGRERPFGVLAVHSRQRLVFSAEDARFLEAVGHILATTAERAASDAVVRASEERFRQQYQELPIPAYSWRREGDDFVLADCNAAGLVATGGKVAEHFGERLSDFYADAPDVAADIRRAAAEQRTLRRDLRYRFQSTAQERDLVVHYVPVPPDIVMAYAEDVTERREAERRREQLAQSEKLRALGQLASGVAHDLNQSLAIIAGYGELAATRLDEPPLDESALREELELITQAAMDGGETVRRLLTFARGNPEGPREPIDLAALLGDIAKLSAPRWRDAAQAEGRPIRLLTEAQGDTTIMGWPSSIREALMNLVFNAVDALPEGGEIRLTAERRGQHVEIKVTDTGSGMPPEVQARVFEPFFTTKGDKGTGLGLAQVFGIVEQHGGNVSLESAEGRGTTFRLTFPASPSWTGDRPELDDAHQELRALRILAVDDEPELGKMLALVLQRGGHVVTVATSGVEALGLLNENEFDVVLSDLGMSGINGWDLVAQVRSRWPRLPFVLATGWGAEIDPEEARRRGVDAVLAKPYRGADLLRVLREVGF